MTWVHQAIDHLRSISLGYRVQGVHKRVFEDRRRDPGSKRDRILNLLQVLLVGRILCLLVVSIVFANALKSEREMVPLMVYQVV